MMRQATKPLPTNLFNFKCVNAHFCPYSSSTPTSDQQKVHDRDGITPFDSSAQQIEKLYDGKSLRNFAAKVKESFDSFQEKRSEDVSKYWPVSTEEWEKLRKQWDNDRREFYDTIEEREPVYVKPGPMTRRLVLWTGMYSAKSEIPEKVNSYKVSEHFKSLFRKILFYTFLVYAGIFFIYRCDETENKL